MGSIFSAWRAWRERREILSDARAIVADAREVNRFKIKDGLTLADAALDNEDRRRATETLDKLTAEFGDDARRHPLALRVMIRLGRFDEAEAAMNAGQRRHPNDPQYLAGLGHIARERHRYEDAVGLYAQLRWRFPGVIDGYTWAADSLRVLGRLEEAEALALEAKTRFPDEIGGYLEYARGGALRQDLPEALRRWNIVIERFDYLGGYIGSAQAMCQLGQYDDAEALLTRARYRFGANPGPLIQYAHVAEARGNAEEAIKRWQDVLWRYPLDLTVYFEVAAALERLGRPEDVVSTLRAGIDRLPTEQRLYLELAKFFHYARRDFSAAADAWAAMHAAFPDNAEAYNCGIEALRQAGREHEAADVSHGRANSSTIQGDVI